MFCGRESSASIGVDSFCFRGTTLKATNEEDYARFSETETR